MVITLVVMLLAFWLMSRFARKQQQKAADEQTRRTEEALVPGTWVRTRAGFYGTVVEVDGEVVTLATALGDESLWAKSAVLGAEEPPFAAVPETDEQEPLDAAETIAEPETVAEPAAEAVVEDDATEQNLA